MIRISKHLFLSLFFIGAISKLFSQNSCPAIPISSAFDPLTFIKTQKPTDPNKPDGIYLGQGTVLRNGVETRPAFIPSNKPTWAIGIAVAWNYHRNLISSIKHPVIGYWMATALQETELACISGLTWEDPSKTPQNMASATLIENNGGCYQFESAYGGMYGLLSQSYPLGRFGESRFNLIAQGVNNMETSALAIAYYDLYIKEVYHKQKGWDVYGTLNCAADVYAFEKTSASGKNGGSNLFVSNQAFFEEGNLANTNWQYLGATTASYPSSIGQAVAVLENNTSYVDYPEGSNFDSYYSEEITWSTILEYLDIIAVMYSEINFDKDITPKVKTAFEKIAGSTSATIPFMDLGPVIDQIILGLPKESPIFVEGAPINVTSNSCSGEKVPYGHFEIVNGSTDVCLGQSTTLQMIVDGGAGSTPTFKWYKNSNPSEIVSTDQALTIVPEEIGTEIWIGEICNDNGCFQVGTGATSTCLDSRIPRGVEVITSECSNCSFTATSTVTNTTCTGMNDGSIILTLVNSPSTYSVSYSGNSRLGTISGARIGSGENFTIDGLVDGNYSIELIDNSNSTCLAYTNAVIGSDIELKETINASSDELENCEVPLNVEIKSFPKSCNRTVRAWNSLIYDWDNNMYITVESPSNGKYLDQNTKTIPATEWNGWSSAEVFERTYSLKPGDTLKFQFVLNTPFAAQYNPYSLEVLDENDNAVYTITAPSGSVTYEAPYSAGFYVTGCPTETPEPYEFNWDPNVIETSTTETSYSGYTVPISNSDITYTVTATNQIQPECIIKDSVVVLKDECGELITKVSKKESKENEDLFTVYPNPSQDIINLKTKAGVRFNTVEVYNLFGDLVMSSRSEKWLNRVTLSLGQLENTVYLIKVYTNSGSFESNLFVKY